LFDGGALQAQLDSANADQEAAVAAYGLAVLGALEEVEGALTNDALLAERIYFLNAAVVNNRLAYDLSTKHYNVGEIDLLSLLQMQSRWIAARMSYIHILNEQLAQRINLHLALGGSFESLTES